MATTLASSKTPDPLYLHFRNETPEGAAAFLHAIVDECIDADIRLQRIAIDPALWDALPSGSKPEIRGVILVADPELNARIAFYRPV